MHNNNCSVQLTHTAANKVKYFIKKHEKKTHLRLRIYILGGGCNGFQYGFTLDDHISSDDYVIENHGVDVVIDFMSLQYVIGGTVDYYEGLDGSKFFVINPNAKTTCSCGSSFSI